MTFEPATTLPSPTGAALALHAAPARQVRAVLHISHGAGEDTARYAPFAGFMARHGFHVYAHDHRGHGRTGAPDALPGHFGAGSAAAKVVTDMEAVLDHIAATHPGLPVMLFGQATGALIALNLLLRRPAGIAGAALLNAEFQPGAPAPLARAILFWERLRLGSDVPSRIMARLSPGSALSVGTWRALFELAAFAECDRGFRPVRRDLPLHLSAGPLAGRMARMGFSNLTSMPCGEKREDFLKPLNRDLNWQDLARWAARIA